MDLSQKFVGAGKIVWHPSVPYNLYSSDVMYLYIRFYSLFKLYLLHMENSNLNNMETGLLSTSVSCIPLALNLDL